MDTLRQIAENLQGRLTTKPEKPNPPKGGFFVALTLLGSALPHQFPKRR
jgi:hypothetical protein